MTDLQILDVVVLVHHQYSSARHDFREFRIARDLQTNSTLQRLMLY